MSPCEGCCAARRIGGTSNYRKKHCPRLTAFATRDHMIVPLLLLGSEGFFSVAFSSATALVEQSAVGLASTLLLLQPLVSALFD